ncbi:MAG: HEAT repeat domain-containing protein, partial [Methanothrix sp.]
MALGWIRDPRAVDPLINGLQDEDIDMRSACAMALGWIKDPKAVDPLIQELTDESSPLCIAPISLAFINDTRAIAPMIELLGSSTCNDDMIAGALAFMGEPALYPLIDVLSDIDENPEKRAAAASALG